MFLQALAWAQMVQDYSKNAPITEALQKTFSGDFPCIMCKKIANEQQKEEKAPGSVKASQKGGIVSLVEVRFAKEAAKQTFFLLALGRSDFRRAIRGPAFPYSDRRLTAYG